MRLQALKHTLTIRPRKVGDHPGEKPKPIEMFVEREDYFGVPREYFLANKRTEHEIELDVTDGDSTRWAGPVSFNKERRLRPEQERAVSTVVDSFSAGGLGGIVRAPCGFGKTVTACALIERLQKPTLIVVHKEFLLNQWKERLQEYLPEVKIGIAQQDECSFVGKHVVIGMVHSLAARDYPQEFLDWPGLILVDEVHRIGAETWAPVPARFRARHRVGLSATPRRKDGADNVFLWHIGQILYASQEQQLKAQVRRVYSDFHLVKTERFNPNLAPKSLKLKFLCASTQRNRLIHDRLIMALGAGRKVLVLSERLQHLRAMESTLRQTWPGPGPCPSTGFYVGGMSEDDLDVAAEARCIFATIQFASEGLDIPALDTEFLTTPLGDVEQAVGRILRVFEGKKPPIVVDFRDDRVEQFRRYGELRDDFYRRNA